MSIQLEVVKNQPLGWAKVAAIECEDCREGDYCSPLAFTQDGANWVSDVISFQGRYLGAVEGECDIMPNLQAATIIVNPEEPEGPIVTINASTIDVEFPANSIGTEFVQFLEVMQASCFYAFSLIVTVEKDSASGTLEVNENIYNITPGQSFSTIALVDASLEQTLNLVASSGVKINVRIASATSTCNLQPQGIKVDAVDYGTITTLVNEFKEIGDYVYQALNYQITLTNDQYTALQGSCGTLTLSAGCCCEVEVESRCVRVTKPTCDTLQFVYSQPFDGFGFAYPSGFNHYIRLIAVIRDPYFMDEDFETYVDSAGRKNVIYSEPREAQVLSYTAPDYVHAAMALAVRHENFRLVTDSGSTFYALVDGEEYRPNWGIERKIAKVVVELEIKQQQLWSKRCN